MAELDLGGAGPDDIPVLLRFWARAGENASRPDDRTEAVAALLERDPEALIVARIDGRIVGTVIIGWDGWRAHVYRLAVDPDFRGRSIARRLVDAAEARARSFGAERMDAMVLDDNSAAHEVWARLGYGRQADWSRWVKPLGAAAAD